MITRFVLPLFRFPASGFASLCGDCKLDQLLGTNTLNLRWDDPGFERREGDRNGTVLHIRPGPGPS